jgi:hypothetical protein
MAPSPTTTQLNVSPVGTLDANPQVAAVEAASGGSALDASGLDASGLTAAPGPAAPPPRRTPERETKPIRIGDLDSFSDRDVQRHFAAGAGAAVVPRSAMGGAPSVILSESMEVQRSSLLDSAALARLNSPETKIVVRAGPAASAPSAIPVAPLGSQPAAAVPTVEVPIQRKVAAASSPAPSRRSPAPTGIGTWALRVGALALAAILLAGLGTLVTTQALHLAARDEAASPPAGDLVARQAAELVGQGRYEEALPLYESLSRSEPENPSNAAIVRLLEEQLQCEAAPLADGRDTP